MRPASSHCLLRSCQGDGLRVMMARPLRFRYSMRVLMVAFLFACAPERVATWAAFVPAARRRVFLCDRRIHQPRNLSSRESSVPRGVSTFGAVESSLPASVGTCLPPASAGGAQRDSRCARVAPCTTGSSASAGGAQRHSRCARSRLRHHRLKPLADPCRLKPAPTTHTPEDRRLPPRPAGRIQ